MQEKKRAPPALVLPMGPKRPGTVIPLTFTLMLKSSTSDPFPSVVVQ